MSEPAEPESQQSGFRGVLDEMLDEQSTTLTKPAPLSLDEVLGAVGGVAVTDVAEATAGEAASPSLPDVPAAEPPALEDPDGVSAPAAQQPDKESPTQPFKLPAIEEREDDPARTAVVDIEEAAAGEDDEEIPTVRPIAWHVLGPEQEWHPEQEWRPEKREWPPAEQDPTPEPPAPWVEAATTVLPEIDEAALLRLEIQTLRDERDRLTREVAALAEQVERQRIDVARPTPGPEIVGRALDATPREVEAEAGTVEAEPDLQAGSDSDPPPALDALPEPATEVDSGAGIDTETALKSAKPEEEAPAEELWLLDDGRITSNPGDVAPPVSREPLPDRLADLDDGEPVAEEARLEAPMETGAAIVSPVAENAADATDVDRPPMTVDLTKRPKFRPAPSPASTQNVFLRGYLAARIGKAAAAESEAQEPDDGGVSVQLSSSTTPPSERSDPAAAPAIPAAESADRRSLIARLFGASKLAGPPPSLARPAPEAGSTPPEPAVPATSAISGFAELEIASPADAGKLRQLQQQLAATEGVHVRMVWGVPRKGTIVAVDLRQPVPLVEALGGFPVVAEVREIGKRGSVHRLAVKLHPAETPPPEVH